jgi:nucleoid DNA-binding protein
MRPVDQYLKELLFEYDCVTVAGLGGFLVQARPAQLFRDRRKIYPPSRIVTFNALLVHDDGLLASAISRAESMDYRSAIRKIEEFVSVTLQKVQSGKEATLEGIGLLQLNGDGNIVFQPLYDHNFADHTYGMESIFVHPAERTEPRKNPASVHHVRKPRPDREKTPASVRWTVMLSLPVIVFLLYGILFPKSYQDLYTSYSGIISDFFHHRTESQEIKPDPVKTETIIINETVQVEEEPVVLPSEPLITPAPEAAAPERVPVTIQDIGPRFYIIGGCFENPENARKFMEELVTRGYQPVEAGTNKRGQLRIGYKSFGIRQEALEYLQQIKASENPAAWLLKY